MSAASEGSLPRGDHYVTLCGDKPLGHARKSTAENSEDKGVKVILRQDYESLGRLGDIVDVKDGYARNYLIPHRIAIMATEGAHHTIHEERQQHARRQAKELRNAEKLAQDLEKISVTIQMKVGEDDKLFGAVTNQMIADALSEKGYAVDKRQIDLQDSIKALGIYDVAVKLHLSVTSKVKVWVVRE